MPNAPVDKSSWGASACYPRRTFDPLSESPSTRNSRITMADFRLCLTCPSHSQAGLYHYALQLISDQLEPTFAHLRYSLGGDRPSQTTDHAMSEMGLNPISTKLKPIASTLPSSVFRLPQSGRTEGRKDGRWKGQRISLNNLIFP